MDDEGAVKRRLSLIIWLLLGAAFVVAGAHGVWRRCVWKTPHFSHRDAGTDDELKWVLGVDGGAEMIRRQFAGLKPGQSVFIVASRENLQASELRFSLGYLLWPHYVWKAGPGPYGLEAVEDGAGIHEKPSAIVLYQIKAPPGASAIPLGKNASVLFATDDKP